MEPVKGFLGRYLRRKLLEHELRECAGTRNAEMAAVVEWLPRVWQHLNKFLETHSSSDVTIGNDRKYFFVTQLYSLAVPIRVLRVRTAALPVLPDGGGRFAGMVHRPVELLGDTVPSGDSQGGLDAVRQTR